MLIKQVSGVSQIVSFVLLIVISIGIALIVGPWAINLVIDISGRTGNTTTTQIICQQAAYDFDTDYGTDGVLWNFTDNNNTLIAKIDNTGTQNLYGFSFEITINSTIIKNFNATTNTQKTESDPLKPGQYLFLSANVTENITGDLNEVKVINTPCPQNSISVNL